MKALLLGGGVPQIAAIKELKKRGITVLLADMSENVVARQYADEFYNVSTLDKEGIKNLAVEQKVDFLISVCTDQALQIVAEVSEELGLPCYIDAKTAVNVSKKSYMKKIFTENGVPTSQFVIMETLDTDKIKHLKYPLIVKPVDSNSSKGVCRINRPEDLKPAFDNAVRISRTKTAIVEEFVEGDEISVDAYIEDGKAHILCLTSIYKIPGNNKFVINRARIPALASDDIASQIQVVAQKIADAFGLKNTPMLIQLISTGERISVVEFCARTGGGIKFLMIKKESGFDVVKAVIDLTLGEKPHVEEYNEPRKLTINEFVYCNPGVLKSLEGFDGLLSDGIINDYKQFKQPGVEFGEINGSGDRVAYFSIEGDTLEDVLSRHKIANSRIKAISEDGSDIIRHDIIEQLHK